MSGDANRLPAPALHAAYVVTPPLTSSMATPLGNGGKDSFIVPMVAHSPRGEGFDASEDGTGAGDAAGAGGV